MPTSTDVARVVLALAVFGGIVAATAATAQDDLVLPKAETRCALEGWLGGKDREAVPVRAAPAPDARLVGTIPFVPYDEDVSPEDVPLAWPVQFDLVASTLGWVKIANVVDDIRRPVLEGEGWVPAELVRFQIQSGRGYAGPSTDSRRILDFKDQWQADAGDIERALGCDGEWMLIEAAIGPKRDSAGRDLPPEKRETVLRRAWFRGICGNARTSCDRPSVDTDAAR